MKVIFAACCLLLAACCLLLAACMDQSCAENSRIGCLGNSAQPDAELVLQALALARQARGSHAELASLKATIDAVSISVAWRSMPLSGAFAQMHLDAQSSPSQASGKTIPSSSTAFVPCAKMPWL